MKKIQGETSSVDKLLRNRKFTIGYFQREYNWKEKHIRELINDLSDNFLENYEKSDDRVKDVPKYNHYYLGSIVVSDKNGEKIIIDGQQRLTSLTLLLIYIRSRLTGREKEPLHDLIRSSKHGIRSFNLDVEERNDCIKALFSGDKLDKKGQSESVINILERYDDIKKYFHKKLKGKALLCFTDWLIYNVYLVEITTDMEVDAYTIFVTMNDRGLPLTSIDKLKGYFLSKIKDDEQRNSVGKIWQEQMLKLKRGTFSSKIFDEATNFVKNWLISQHAEEFSKDEDIEAKFGLEMFQQFDFFDQYGSDDVGSINTDPYRWVSEDPEKHLKIKGRNSFDRFVKEDFVFYSNWYKRIRAASEKPTKGLEAIYLAWGEVFAPTGIPYHLLLAPLLCGEEEEESLRKLCIVAKYVDILLSRNAWEQNQTWLIYGASSIVRTTPQLLMDIRRKPAKELAETLIRRLNTEKNGFNGTCRLRSNGINKSSIHRLLARITYFVEIKSGKKQSYYEDYLRSEDEKNAYEIEHILSTKPKGQDSDFEGRARYRNYIGGLLLLPKSFNSSYGSKPYAQKRKHYYGQNLLAQSLYERTYTNNPRFIKFIKKFELPFKKHSEFKKADIDERQELYRAIAKKIWDPETLRLELEN